MKISACLIVKNEEKNLQRLLPQLKDFVDEIIVVDTGSSDNTCQFVEKYGCKLYHFTWQDDFSAARNFALSKSSGDWVIFLDADEYFVQKNTAIIKNILVSADAITDGFLIKIINIDTDKNNTYIDDFYALRIFRPNRCHYIKKIHEQLVKNDGNEMKTALISSITLYHTGYSTNISAKKAARNLSILQQTDFETEPLSLIEAAEAYDGVGNTEKALYYANKAVSYGRQTITYASRPYRLLIKLLEKKNTPTTALQKAIEVAMLDFPSLPDFPAEYANVLAKDYCFNEAIVYMQEALSLKKTYHDIEPTLFTEEKIPFAFQSMKRWQAILNRVPKIRLSACVIVKNEAKNIQKWYACVSRCSDEQIVVDTGSTDSTLQILKTLPVKLYQYKWQDDFAAAKNFALDKANGDWIIFLDADEYFSDISIEKVRRVVAAHEVIDKNPDIIRIMKINLEKNDNSEISRFYDIRLFRNKKNLRYEGKIHEQLVSADKILKCVKNNVLLIYHTGYSRILMPQKAARNLRILQASMETSPLWHYMADCYYSLGNYEAVVECARKYFSKKEYKVLSAESNIWNTYLNALLKTNRPISEINCEIIKAVNQYPNLPDFYALAGIFFFNKKNYPKAKKYLLKAMDIFKNKKEWDVQECSSFSMYKPTVEKCLYNLAALGSESTDFAEKIMFSTCTIVKNGEKEIIKWIKSMQKLADELIIVDTGSNDATIKKAAALGVNVYTIKWQEDFAAAKNYALSKAKGQWIIFLDADEYFAEDVQKETLLQIIQQNTTDAFLYKRINIDLDSENILGTDMQLRMFKNDTDIKYQGIIHEQLIRLDKQELIIKAQPEIVFYHTGYSQRFSMQKVKRNLTLLKKDIFFNGLKKYHYRYLADCYYNMQDYTKAEKYYHLHLASGLHSLGNESDVYNNLINIKVKLHRNENEIMELLEKANALFPLFPLFTFQYALLYYRREKYEEAKKYFLLALSEHKTTRNNLEADNFLSFLPDIYYYLALITKKENDIPTSLNYIYTSLKADKYNYKALRFLASFPAIKDLSLIDMLTAIYNQNIKDISFILNNILYVGRFKVAAHYVNILWENYNIIPLIWKEYELFMQNNDKDTILNDLLKQTVENIQLLFLSILSMGNFQDEYKDILPSNIWHLIERFYNKTGKLSAADFDAYNTLLPCVLKQAKENIITKYIMLAVDFDTAYRENISRTLIKNRHWNIAYSLLDTISTENMEENCMIDYGICLYYMNKFTEAEKYLQKISSNHPRKNEIDSYLTWIQERSAGR